MKQQTKISSNPIIEGAIWKQILFFFFPILLGSFFQQFYNTIDMVIVGRFVGTQALASVGGSSGQIVGLVVGFFTGLSAGAGVMISQYYGAGNEKGVNDSLHTAYALAIGGGIIFTIFGVLLSPKILSWMNTPEDILPLSETYLKIYFAGILFVFVYNIGSGILRALGDSKTPLYVLIICCIVNIILDLCFVLFLHMGVAGVAIATLIAQAISAVLVTLVLMHSKDIYRLELRKIRFHMHLLKSQMYLGIPGGVQSIMYSLSNIIIQTAVNGFGTNATAAWAAHGKLDAIFWMLNGAYGVSITTFAGQNYGAGKMERVKKGAFTCLLMHQCTSVLISVTLLLFRYPLFHIFTADAEVAQIGADMLRIIAPCYALFSFIEIFSGTLRAMGDVMIPMFLTLFGICLFRVIWILLIVPMNPSMGMVIVNYPVSWGVTAVLFILYFCYRIKKNIFQTEKKGC